MRWYEKSMPTIKDVTPFVNDFTKSLRSIKGVKSIYTFGSFAENRRNPKYNIKDIDILVLCSFESGDLLSIDNDQHSPLNMTRNDLEDEGFNPYCVDFTKKCISMNKLGFDVWAISADKELLHWGHMPESVEEWKEIRNIADKKASSETSLKRSQLCSAGEEQRRQWKDIYESEMLRMAGSNPLGWYASMSKCDDILKRAILLE